MYFTVTFKTFFNRNEYFYSARMHIHQRILKKHEMAFPQKSNADSCSQYW